MNLLNNLKKTLEGNHETEDKIPYIGISDALRDSVSRYTEEHRLGSFPINLSSLINFCPRQHFLFKRLDVKPVRTATRADLVVRSIGRAIETLNRNELFKTYGKHRAYGLWQCACRKTMSVGLGKKDFKCNHCQTSVLTHYEEYDLCYDNLIIGHPDFLLKMGEDELLTVIEQKSINGKDFKSLKFASPEHKQQGYGYFRLAQLLEESFNEVGIKLNKEYFIVLYTNKHYVFEQFSRSTEEVDREFRINVKRDLSESYKQWFDESLKAVKFLYKYPDRLPKRTVCNDIQCPKAKSCPVKNECFNLND